MLRYVYFLSLFLFLFLKLVLLASGFSARVTSFVPPPPYVSSVLVHPSRVCLKACPVSRASFGEPWFFKDSNDGDNESFGNKSHEKNESHKRDGSNENERNESNEKNESEEMRGMKGEAFVSCKTPCPFPPRAFRESSRGVALDALNKQKKELEEIQDSMISLQNEVRSLQKIIQEMCTSLIRCDDMILLERDLLHQGSIFTSNGQTEGLLKRTPLTLRTSVLNITNQYNIPLMQRTYEWNGSSELDL